MLYAEEDLKTNITIEDQVFDPLDVAIMFVLYNAHESKEYTMPTGPLKVINQLIERRHLPSRRQVAEASRLAGALKNRPLKEDS
jgi:hypothetical protein